MNAPKIIAGAMILILLIYVAEAAMSWYYSNRIFGLVHHHDHATLIPQVQHPLYRVAGSGGHVECVSALQIVDGKFVKVWVWECKPNGSDGDFDGMCPAEPDSATLNEWENCQ